MPLLLHRSAFAFFIFVIAFSLQANEVTPHPEFADRLVQTRGELTIEYAPGQEAYAEAVFVEMEVWRKEIDALKVNLDSEEALITPLSLQDMTQAKEEILLAIARAIGLEKPTKLQENVYDDFLNGYASIENIRKLMFSLLSPDKIMIWKKERLSEHLVNGIEIEGTSYNAETDIINFIFNKSEHSSNPNPAPTNRQSTFNYNSDGESETISASVTIGDSIEPKELSNSDEPHNEPKAKLISFPFVIREDELPTAPRVLVQQNLFGQLRALANQQKLESQINPMAILVLLHETTEIGLVDRYINSRDRRWICDGTANYVSWKVAKDRAGIQIANQIYDLESQLKAYKSLQPKINLRKWPASEKQDVIKFGEKLNSAHYPFATRAIFAFAEEHGENAIADLWKAIGKSPKRKTNMKTVSKVYQKQSRKKLSRLIKEAENNPIP